MTSRSARPAARHAAPLTRTHMSSPGLTTLSRTPSPREARRRCTTPSRRPSPGNARVSVPVDPVSLNGTTPHDDGFAGGGRFPHHRLGAFAAPTGAHVLVLDPLLEEHDALEQGFRPRRAPGHVDVDGDDLIDTFGDRVAVPVWPAAVGTRAHRDHVLRIRHLLVQSLDGWCHLVRDRTGHHDEVGLAGTGRQRDDAETHDVVTR